MNPVVACAGGIEAPVGPVAGRTTRADSSARPQARFANSGLFARNRAPTPRLRGIGRTDFGGTVNLERVLITRAADDRSGQQRRCASGAAALGADDLEHDAGGLAATRRSGR